MRGSYGQPNEYANNVILETHFSGNRDVAVDMDTPGRSSLVLAAE